MPSFNGLSLRNIFLLSSDWRGTLSLGSPAFFSLYKDDEDIIALMATVTSIQRPQERGRVMPLLEVLYDLPPTLRDGRISWLVLPGEETPSTIVIHKDLTTENVIRLATSRLVRLDLENMTGNRFSPNYLSRFRKSIHQARERAANASLENSESIAAYLEQAYPPQGEEPQLTMSATASIVINRSPETIFAFFSDPQHHRFGLEDSEEQGEEVKRTYRFFGIPVTLKGQEIHIKETRQLTSGPIGLGTVFEQVGTLHGRIHKSRIQITQYEPTRNIEFTYSPALMRTRIVLKPTSGNTLLTMTITLKSGCRPFIGFMWTSLVKQDLHEGLKRLKATLESPEV